MGDASPSVPLHQVCLVLSIAPSLYSVLLSHCTSSVTSMTINKSQGQTVKHVGLDLRSPVFTHGQLYVGISRHVNNDTSYHTEQWGNELSVWETLDKDIQNIPEQWGNELSSLTAAGQLYILSAPSADLTSSTLTNPPRALVHAGGRTMRAGMGCQRSAT